MERTWQFGQVWNIPNGLSLSRVLLGLAMPVWWELGTEALIAVVFWAGISDWLDGWWARRFRVHTALGQVIDPLTDKVFTTAFLLVAAMQLTLPLLWWLFAGNLCYDLYNVWQRRTEIGAAFRGESVSKQKCPVTVVSKTKTALLFVSMMAIALFGWFPNLPLGHLAVLCIVLIGVSWLHNQRHWIRAVLQS